ncbi:hypothetical protein Holit_02383 [Hollandina sp. SP2]
MNKKLIFPAMLVCLLALGLAVVSCGNDVSRLAGIWEDESGNSSIELFKDGTGNWDGVSATWKIENERFVLTGMGLSFSFDYTLSGSTLTLTDTKEGESHVVKKK